MKRMRSMVVGLALAGAMMFAPRAEAQVQLGWNSSMSTICLNTSCDWVQFTLNLSGLKPTDNNGNSVPAAIVGLNSPGYVTSMTIDALGGVLFTSASYIGSGNFAVSIFGGGILIDGDATALPYPSAPIVVNANLTLGGYNQFAYSGLAYLGNTGQCYTSAGAVTACASNTYRQGDFNGTTTAVPEPMTMTLLATGLVGMGLASYRRRKQQAE